MLNILIASDHQPFREVLTELLSAQPLFNVIDVCADMHAAMCITADEQPHIVLIDGSGDLLAAIQATKKIVASSNAGVIALSRDLDQGFADHMMAAGALGYLTKKSSAAEIITAINEVAKDNVYFCKESGQLPIPTPSAVSSFKKLLSSIGVSTRKRIAEVTESHWHGILKYTN